MNNKVRIFCTNDLHSHADQFKNIELAVAQCQSRQSLPALQVDAGDWFSGTIYSWIGPRFDIPCCPELHFFMKNKVVANLGNHEFDATVEGLRNMLEKAKRIKYNLLVCTNIVIEDACKLRPYYSCDLGAPNILNQAVIFHLDGFGKVGVLGVMGEDAVLGCQASIKGENLSFLTRNQTARLCTQLAQALRTQHDCRMIVLLFHGGKEELGSYNMRKVADFYVCGHTHEAYPAKTRSLTSQASSYGFSLGVHDIVMSDRPTLLKSEIVPIELSHERHDSYQQHIVPLLSRIGIHRDSYPYDVLPLIAQRRIQRTATCPFASWVCDSILSELRRSFDLPLHGFFIANELIRSDFTSTFVPGRVSLADTCEILECTQSSVDTIGVELWAIETTPIQLLFLHAAFIFGTTFITANAIPAYSSKFLTLREPTSRINVVTTKFMAESLTPLPAVLFNATHVVQKKTLSLSILLHQYLGRQAPASGATSHL